MEELQKTEALCSYFEKQIDGIDSIVLNFDNPNNTSDAAFVPTSL